MNIRAKIKAKHIKRIALSQKRKRQRSLKAQKNLQNILDKQAEQKQKHQGHASEVRAKKTSIDNIKNQQAKLRQKARTQRQQ